MWDTFIHYFKKNYNWLMKATEKAQSRNIYISKDQIYIKIIAAMYLEFWLPVFPKKIFNDKKTVIKEEED